MMKIEQIYIDIFYSDFKVAVIPSVKFTFNGTLTEFFASTHSDS